MAIPENVTLLLHRARDGDAAARDELLPLVYQELRRAAARAMRRERSAQTLQTTALVHETYLRLFGRQLPQVQDRAHFLAIAARSMRQILVERARARNAAKRAGQLHAVSIDDESASVSPPGEDVLALDEALARLAAIDARQSHVVELRFFGGLDVDETAEALGISPATVKRDWTVARAWLYRELMSIGGPTPGGAAVRQIPTGR